MKKRLIKWDDFLDKMEILGASIYLKYQHYRVAAIIIYKDIKWSISKNSKKQFGTIVEVNEYKTGNFTHTSINGVYYYHELWFEPEFEDFLKEDEFII